MNKKQAIVTAVFAAALLIIAAFVCTAYFASLNFSQGVILRADNGACLLIKGSEPIVLAAKDKTSLNRLETGDKVLVAHSGIAESYPAQSEAYFWIKLGSGHKIDENVLSALAELGWVQGESKGISYAAQYIRTNGEYPKAHYVVISSKEELAEYYKKNRDIYDLERKDKVYSDTTIGFLDACDKYDDAFFAEKALVLAVLTEPSGSNKHEISSVRAENGTLIITIKRILPECHTDDMACWHIFVELCKEDLGSCENILLEITE